MDTELLKINTGVVSDILIRFLSEEIKKIGVKRGILGLSGGVDSSVVACLLARALGPENVYALIMPYRLSNPESRAHAEMLARQLKINYFVRDISPMVDAFFAEESEADQVRRGNKMARERMCLLYDYSAKYQALVIGTSNKTELLLGYGTIHGDLASAINPIGDLYKTHIWQLAEYLGVPREIIDKPPSADLWVGQTDEQELGYTYQEIDRLLYYMVDLRYSNEMLLELGYTPQTINDIYRRMQKSQFKRRPPVIAKVSYRTINQDYRYSRDWGF
ncbi:NAD+ synthase [Caldithrix abyssi]|uniref:NH(3)-dependent NAD(+) synthetase n=1 Tax=Caldithrix abyssi DSM 13497 TaxID=880073 RepID=H1XX69_CALAY|nr:NAD+ synthase [Caldithrix abyssi]APF20695.1 nadE NH(3)-dependent NAD(+) synthetase [Caldithrix abyssi DSM 13497]EHO40806.1 NH(3)-dependent NAD(+) synthetase [Caldithrix abyssi DSM 13497]